MTETLRSEKQVKGHEEIEELETEKNDLEGLTVTFKTTAQMISEQGW